MCRKFSIAPEDLHASLEWRENEANVARWHELGAFTQDYVRLTRTPRSALRELVDHLGVPFRHRAAFAAWRATRPRKVRRNQARVERDTWDPVTLVHWNHLA